MVASNAIRSTTKKIETFQLEIEEKMKSGKPFEALLPDDLDYGMMSAVLTAWMKQEGWRVKWIGYPCRKFEAYKHG